MSDNNAINNATTNNKVQVSGMEKKGFFAGLKEKKEAFVEKHPKGCSIARKIGKGLAIGGAAVGGFVLGNVFGSNKSGEHSGIDVIETGEVFDDASNDAVDNDNN
jgi:hypothetical protein